MAVVEDIDAIDYTNNINFIPGFHAVHVSKLWGQKLCIMLAQDM